MTGTDMGSFVVVSIQLVSCALDLLRTRLPLIKSAHRTEIKDCVKTALATCGKRITIGIPNATKPEPHLPLAYAVETLGDITINATSAEQSVLSQLYAPLLVMLKTCHDSRLASSVLSVLAQLV